MTNQGRSSTIYYQPGKIQSNDDAPLHALRAQGTVADLILYCMNINLSYMILYNFILSCTFIHMIVLNPILSYAQTYFPISHHIISSCLPYYMPCNIIPVVLHHIRSYCNIVSFSIIVSYHTIEYHNFTSYQII